MNWKITTYFISVFLCIYLYIFGISFAGIKSHDVDGVVKKAQAYNFTVKEKTKDRCIIKTTYNSIIVFQKLKDIKEADEYFKNVCNKYVENYKSYKKHSSAKQHKYIRQKKLDSYIGFTKTKSTIEINQIENTVCFVIISRQEYTNKLKTLESFQKNIGYGALTGTYLISLHCAIFIFALILFLILIILPYMFIFKKANVNPFLVLIPYYNNYLFAKIAFKKPLIPFIISIIPIICRVYWLIYWYFLAKIFNKSTTYAIFCIILFPFFAPLIAFDDSKYKGPVDFFNSQKI